MQARSESHHQQHLLAPRQDPLYLLQHSTSCARTSPLSTDLDFTCYCISSDDLCIVLDTDYAVSGFAKPIYSTPVNDILSRFSM